MRKLTLVLLTFFFPGTSLCLNQLKIWGDSLLSERAINMQAKSEDNEQRDNIFYTHYLVNSKACSMIINGGICANMATRGKLRVNMYKPP